MEGVGDRCFRRAMASVGGFDEAVTDFLRVSANPHIQSLARMYDFQETLPIPLAAQLMGSNEEHMANMAREIEKRGAPRIDLNCGCPSNTVTGHGAGSSLLKDPKMVYRVAKAMVQAVSIPVTIKMRSGYADTSLFKENLLAAQESGVQYITLHPRTKIEGYGPAARWELIAEAKSILRIPVVGNGDILSVQDALNMIQLTGCDALMIGRGSVINPFLFQEIKAHFAGKVYRSSWDVLLKYLETYISYMPVDVGERQKINKLKQLMGFLFKRNIALLEHRQIMLRAAHTDMNSFLDFAMPFLRSFSLSEE